MKVDIKPTPKSPEGDFFGTPSGAGGVFEESNKPLFISFKGYFLTKIEFSRMTVLLIHEYGHYLQEQAWGTLTVGSGLNSGVSARFDGNKLVKVEDSGSDQGFNNGTAGIDDYGYDAAGNITHDLNKSITEIGYNILNLPNSISYGDKQITYVFDATGAKLGTRYEMGGELQKAIDNVGTIQYVDGQITSLGTGHGRAIKIRDNYFYEYTLTDHLGNNRVSFGLLPETFVYKATMEDAYNSTESDHFDNISSTRVFLPTYNHTPASVRETDPDKVARLNGTTRAIGPAKILEVSAGDAISMEAFATYIEDTGGDNAIISDLAGALTSSLNLAADPELISAISAINTSLPAFSASVDTHDNVPKAYLNYVYFDENYANPQFGYEEVTSEGHNKLQRLSLEIESPGNGYLFVYVANESAVPSAEVFFDDLTIIHQATSTDLQVTHASDYYPFGMPFNSYENEGLSDILYLYQGKELEEEVNLYDFHARLYDPATGRFMAADPMGHLRPHHSSYMAMGNNPISNIDPDGEFFGSVITAVGDFFKSGFFDGGFDPSGLWNGGDWDYFRSAWSGYDPTATGTPTNNAWKIDKGRFQTDPSRSFFGRTWQLVSKFTWELPQTTLGNTFSHGLNLTGQVNEVNHFRGATVLDTDLEGGAFTLGSYIIGPEGFQPDFRDHLFVHEYGHYLQSQRLGPLYMSFVALPSVTDFYLGGEDRHDTRWYEAGASRLAANYFDREFGSGADGYFVGSTDFFDRNSFVNDRTNSPYRNPRNGGFNPGGHPLRSRFHWTDIPFSLMYNGGFGLFGFLFN